MSAWPSVPARSPATILAGTEHAVEVTAESLYEAVAQARCPALAMRPRCRVKIGDGFPERRC